MEIGVVTLELQRDVLDPESLGQHGLYLFSAQLSVVDRDVPASAQHDVS